MATTPGGLSTLPVTVPVPRNWMTPKPVSPSRRICAVPWATSTKPSPKRTAWAVIPPRGRLKKRARPSGPVLAVVHPHGFLQPPKRHRLIEERDVLAGEGQAAGTEHPELQRAQAGQGDHDVVGFEGDGIDGGVGEALPRPILGDGADLHGLARLEAAEAESARSVR